MNYFYSDSRVALLCTINFRPTPKVCQIKFRSERYKLVQKQWLLKEPQIGRCALMLASLFEGRNFIVCRCAFFVSSSIISLLCSDLINLVNHFGSKKLCTA